MLDKKVVVCMYIAGRRSGCCGCSPDTSPPDTSPPDTVPLNLEISVYQGEFGHTLTLFEDGQTVDTTVNWSWDFTDSGQTATYVGSGTGSSIDFETNSGGNISAGVVGTATVIYNGVTYVENLDLPPF